jgi:AAA family ATP:ADP antiporter
MNEKSQGIVHTFLRLFTDIKPGEASTAILLMLNVYLLLMAYYIIKPVRDALMLEEWPPEIKNYLSAAIAVLLVFAVKAFSSISSRFSRQHLITWVTLFFISNLVLFYALHLGGIGAGTMGIIFYIWVSIFNVIVVAQFWGFANDIYTEESGKRMFPLIAFGATFGGYSGGKITDLLVVPLGTFQLMLVAGGILGVCILITWVIHKKEIKKKAEKNAQPVDGKTTDAVDAEKPLEKGGAFRLVFNKKYLLYIAIFVLLLNFVNTNGVYMLDTVAKNMAVQAVEAGTSGGLDVGQYLTKFFASFYNIMNLFAMFVQLFIVSRIFKWFGVRTAIFILPVLALGGYFALSFGAALMLVRWVKVIDNGLDYSLMNTTRHSLYLITPRIEKYKAQAVTKTFFHRAGDVLSAVLIFVGTTFLAFKIENIAMANVGLILVWIFLGVLIFKEHKRLSAERQQEF